MNASVVTTSRVDVSGLGIRYTAWNPYQIAWHWDSGSVIALVDGAALGSFPCDERIKTVTGPYTRGLPEILQIDPIVYRYRGNDHAPKAKSIRDLQREHIGISAQSVEHVIPELVQPCEGFIDGKPVDDLRELVGTEPLLYALLNSVKELHTRLAALEGGTHG